jgi:hypothetical protein
VRYDDHRHPREDALPATTPGLHAKLSFHASQEPGILHGLLADLSFLLTDLSFLLADLSFLLAYVPVVEQKQFVIVRYCPVLSGTVRYWVCVIRF